MGKTKLGEFQTQTALNNTSPSGNAGIAIRDYPGDAKPLRWLVSSEIIAASPTNASKNLATAGSGDLNTVVGAKTLKGADGNGILVTAVGDSTPARGVWIEEIFHLMTVVIHYVSGVSTVAQVEAAITAQSTFIDVDSAGTAGTVLTAPGDNFENAALAGGTNSVATYSLFLWGRDANTQKWGLYSDVYANVVKGEIGTALSGRHHSFLKDLGNFDRVYFAREGSGSDVVNVSLHEVLAVGTGN